MKICVGYLLIWDKKYGCKLYIKKIISQMVNTKAHEFQNRHCTHSFKLCCVYNTWDAFIVVYGMHV